MRPRVGSVTLICPVLPPRDVMSATPGASICVQDTEAHVNQAVHGMASGATRASNLVHTRGLKRTLAMPGIRGPWRSTRTRN